MVGWKTPLKQRLFYTGGAGCPQSLEKKWDLGETVQIAAHYAKDFLMKWELSRCKNSNMQREGPGYAGHTEWTQSTSTKWPCVGQIKS